MRIGIDTSSLIAQNTGIGIFASHLLEEFKRDPQGIEFVELRPGRPGDLNTPKRLLWEGYSLPRKARAERVDLLYSPGFSPSPSKGIKKVVTVHDLIGLIFPTNVSAASRFYWSYWLPRNLKRADRLIASSECTKRDIVRLLKMPAEKIEVVPLAAREGFRVMNDPGHVRRTLETHGLRQPYFIAVGTMEPRKNYLRLLHAFRGFQKKHPNFSLIIIGKDAGAEAELKKFVCDNGLENSVRLAGYVAQEELVSLYNGAFAYAMISLYEGFGLPALEAMQCGLTGVISNNSSVPEIAGDTAIAVAPEDEGAIEAALTALAADRERMKHRSEKALLKAKTFSIQKTAARMIEIFKRECR